MPADADTPLPAFPDELSALGDAGFSWDTTTPDTAYGELEELTEAAAREGIVDDLPESGEVARAGEYRLRAAVIAERMWLLGYVGKSKAAARALFENSREDFLKAVAAFQADAGLETDSWAGKKTWTAFEELVSFEGQKLSPRWYSDEAARPALLRAVQLRLSALGLDTRRPGPGFKAPSSRAVRKFHRIIWSLGVTDQLMGDRLEEASIAILLDQDRLIEAVVARARPLRRDGVARLHFSYRQQKRWREEVHRELIRAFLVQLAKVELWLLGLDLPLAERSIYPVFQFGKLRPKRKPERDDVGKILLDYYVHFVGLEEAPAIKKAATITPELFASFLTQEGVRDRGEPDEPRVDYPDAIAARFTSQEDVEQAIRHGRSLGMRLWDGLKRLWRWIKRRITRVIDFGRNLFRGFYRYATKGFQILRRAIRAFSESVETYSRGEIAIDRSDAPRVFLFRDFDSATIVPPQVTGDTAVLTAQRVRLFSDRLLFAAQVLSLVFNAILTATLKRWARFVRVLARHLTELTRLYRRIQEAESGLEAVT